MSDENEKHLIQTPTEPQDVEISSTELGNEAERRLIRKLDLVLIPLATLIFCLNFVDRTAIGNAKIAGLEKDLGMEGYDYNIVLTVFYLFFIFSEIPSNLALKRFGSTFLAAMVVGFGVITICTAFVTSYAGLMITRVFLGIAEGGTLPGLTYILSRYYRRSEFVLRVGIFFGVAPCLAGAFGGLLASGILALDDMGSVKSWRKIFLVEGIITVIFGIICLVVLPTDPQHSRMLNDQERAIALARIDADQAVRTRGHKERTTLRLVWRAFNFNTTLCAIAYLMVNISFQGLSLFLPTVIQGLGHYWLATIEVQLRTVPPFLVSAVWVVCVTYSGYRTKQRSLPILLTIPLVIIGYGISISTKNSDARYAACFLSISGLTPCGILFLAWGTDNAAPDTVRAVTTAIIPGVGAFGAVIAAWTYLPKDASSGYMHGNKLNLATSSMVFVLAAVGALYVRWENGKRDRGERDYRLEGKSPEEIEQLGYLHPNFRYQI
ncbi:MFS general substrate transporter [Infundibulicybe gibba]|nr:MFS general substrate transporter [Infundibulicybe gibba]